MIWYPKLPKLLGHHQAPPPLTQDQLEAEASKLEKAQLQRLSESIKIETQKINNFENVLKTKIIESQTNFFQNIFFYFLKYLFNK